MGYWSVGCKSLIFLNKYHKNAHGSNKIDHVPQAPHPITPSLHYSGYKILRQSRRTLTWPKGPDFSGQSKYNSMKIGCQRKRCRQAGNGVWSFHMVTAYFAPIRGPF